jgi:hypothetical protein
VAQEMGGDHSINKARASKISKEKSISSVVPVLEKVSDENQTASISIKSKAKANKRLATLAR